MKLMLLTSPWSFAVWGIDLIGALSIGKGQVKYAIVTINYFTKWVEAEPLAKISSQKSVGLCQKIHNIYIWYAHEESI